MNYEFLKAVPQMDKLHTACCDAERFIGTEPNYAVAAARRSIEYMVKLLYSSSVSPYIEGLSVFDMLSDPVLQKYLDDPQLISEIHSIRKCGNRAVHEGAVSPEEAEDVLRLLHHVIGESCMFLGLIDGYPDYSDKRDVGMAASVAPSEIELEISQEFVSLLHTHVVKHMDRRQERRLINVHQKEMPSSSGKKKVDSGANSKTAFYQAVDYLKLQFPDLLVRSERTKLLVTLVSGEGKETVIAVKSGCPQLSTVIDDELQILPGIDFVLYAPDFSLNDEAVDQLHVFSKDNFLKMWQDLGLIRKKVSSPAQKKYKELYGPDFKTNIEEHADIVAVQSFSNSGIKRKAVWESLQNAPALTKDGVSLIKNAMK